MTFSLMGIFAGFLIGWNIVPIFTRNFTPNELTAFILGVVLFFVSLFYPMNVSF